MALSLLLTTLLASGCAKFPETAVISGKQLVITLKVAGRIEPTDSTDPSIRRYYFVAIDNDSDPNTGPWAVVAPPFGGNGWVTSAQAARSIGVTSFLKLGPEDPTGNVYGILPGSFFLNTTPAQPPVNSQLLEGGSTIRFVVDFNQIATTAFPADSIAQLNLNFITTNELAVNPDFTYPNRIWDSLGPSGQDYINTDTTSNRTYSGVDDNGDVRDLDLDIVFWSVEVQSISSR